MKKQRADAKLSSKKLPGILRQSEFQQHCSQLFLMSRQGHPELFGDLAEQIKPWLLRRLRRHENTQALCQNPDDCEETLQESFLKAWEHREAFVPERGCFTAWLWAITHNTAVSLLRKRRQSDICLHPQMADTLPDKPRAGTDPVETMAIKEIQERFQSALAAVTCPIVRKALELRFSEGMPYQDIAKELGVSLGTVATWVRRLRLNVEIALCDCA